MVVEVRESEGVLYLPGTSCEGWISLQNPAFHLSMLAYLIAFLVPQTFRYYAPMLRSCILIAIFLGMVWGAMYWCTWDILIWGAVFFVQNFVQLLYAFYKLRHVDFAEELELLYTETFQPFGVTRAEFRALVQHNCKSVLLQPGGKYAVEGCTSVDERISILVSGRMRVLFRGDYLHDILERELIDSAEWESSKMKRGEIFQVTVEAVDTSEFLCWNREKLQFYLDAHPKLQAVFRYLRGHDILKKVHATALNSYRRSTKDITANSVCVTKIRQSLLEEDPAALFSHL